MLFKKENRQFGAINSTSNFVDKIPSYLNFKSNGCTLNVYLNVSTIKYDERMNINFHLCYIYSLN